jgi:hypothetical protein
MPVSEYTEDFAAELTALVAGLVRDTPELGTGLTQVIQSAPQRIPGVEYAGITSTIGSRQVTTPAATHRYPVLLDEIQQKHHSGPCLSAAWQHHVIRVDDLSRDDRWPLYRRDVLALTPIRSVLSLELAASDDRLSALNFYAEKPDAFGQEALRIGRLFAAYTSVAWSMLQKEEQFRGALRTRDIIGQAKGVLMERFNIDADMAFTMLSKLSQQMNVKVADISQRLINTDHPPQSHP